MDVEHLMRQHQHSPTFEPEGGSEREEKSPLLRPPYDRRFAEQPVVPPEEFSAILQPGVFLASALTLRWISTNLVAERTGGTGPEVRPITKPEELAQCSISFRRSVVVIRFFDESDEVVMRKGLVDLARVLTSDHPLDVSELVNLPLGVGGESRTPLMDKPAVKAVRRRLEEITEAIEIEAGAYAEDELKKFAEEREQLERQLALTHGLGGRERTFEDSTAAVERARRALVKRMDEAIAALKDSMPRLEQHLHRSIKREGTKIAYDPGSPKPVWHVEGAPSPRG
jgi:hypothetical protein